MIIYHGQSDFWDGLDGVKDHGPPTETFINLYWLYWDNDWGWFIIMVSSNFLWQSTERIEIAARKVMFRFLQRTKKKTSYPVDWGCYKPCLVVEPYPSEKYEFVSWDYEIPNIWENKTCSKPPTRNGLLHFSWHSDALQLLHVTSGCPNASHSNLETVDGAFCTSASWCSRLGFLDSLLHIFFVQSGSSFRDWDQLTSTNKKSTVCKLLLLLESNVKRKDSEMTVFPEVIWRMWQSHAKPPIFHGKNLPISRGMMYDLWKMACQWCKSIHRSWVLG